jgi:putative transposase
MRRPVAPRLKSFPYIGFYRYFLTICTRGRQRVFVDASAVQDLTSQLLQIATREKFAVLAYCFMPDHLHLLIEALHEAADMRAFLHRWKQTSAYAWKQRFGQDLWQRGYFEHTLRGEEDSVAIARYLIGNPIRAGLVNNVVDYPFIGSQVMELKELIYSVQADVPEHRRNG